MLTSEQLTDLESAPGRIIVAYSGGCDSHVLLHYLSRELGRTVEALHINHGIQREADAWQAHCESVCDELNVPLAAFSVAVKRSGSLETNAREARYLVFKTYLKAGDRLLLAHHQDDQVETLLLNLTSGRAPFGWLGMPPKRRHGLGEIERPLLHVPQGEILSYAKAQDLKWIEDPSNADTQHTRNLLRHDVLPGLRGHWPDIHQKLISAWENTESFMVELEVQAERDLQRVQLGQGLIDLESFAQFSELRQQACMRKFLSHAGYEKTLGEKTLTELCRTVESGSNGFDLGSWFLQSFGQKLYFNQVAAPDENWLTNLGASQAFSGGELLTDISKGMGFSIPANQMRCHVRVGGESIHLRGQHKKLKNLFQEYGFPPHVRELVPLVWLDDECIGVCGIPVWGIPAVIADSFAVAEDEFGCELSWSPSGLHL